MKYLKINKNITVLLMIIIWSVNLTAQKINAKIIYKKKSNIVIKPKDKKKATGIILKKIFSNMEKMEYILNFNNEASIFKPIDKMNIDGVDNLFSVKLSKMWGGSAGIFYTDKKTSVVYHQEESFSEIYIVEYSKIKDWKLTQEKKKIGRYICYKATKIDTFSIGSSGNVLKKKITAWYTTEIPHNFGPLKYNGLPGLILELKNDKVTFYAKEIHLNIKENIDIEKPKKGVKISVKDYKNMIRGLTVYFRKNNPRK